MSDSDLGSAPGLRAIQAGATAPDDLASSINLFRGQVMLPLELVSLIGRNGLDVSITANYSSAVGQDVRLRNRDAPTGVLGVGWSLGYERIILGDRQTALAEQQRMFLVDQTGVQRLYRVGDSNGAVAFQTQEYQFWKIELLDVEDPSSTRWRIVREDGSTRLFGGGTATERGAAWGGWAGPSVVPGAEAYPVAWDLAEITSPQGDSISFTYESDTAEIGGVATTRSTRLTRVADVFGRGVELQYKEKEDFENDFPDQAPDWASPAYQFTFQTQYLDEIIVRERSGDVAFSQQLGYEFLDVVAPSGSPRPEYTKRYLTSVRQAVPGARTLPALTLSYEDDSDADAPGAIRRQGFVTGASATYDYVPSTAAHSSTALEVSGPPDHRPQVWHGADFTVLTWYDDTSGHLELGACAWSGVWRVWRDLLPAAANDDLSVLTGDQFFAVRYTDRSTGLPSIRLYHENPYQLGTWVLTDVELGSEFADLRLAAGTNFLAMQGRGNGWVRILAWDALRKAWNPQDLDTPDSTELALGGGDGFLLGAFDTDGTGQLRLQIFYADAAGNWSAGGYTDVTEPVDWKLTQPDGVWSVGSALGAATFVTGQDGQSVSAVAVLLSWRAGYQLASAEAHPVTQPTDAHNPIAYSVLADSLLGHAGDTLRFDAGQWKSWHLLDPTESGEFRYAYGSDVALAAQLQSGTQVFIAARYDPYAGDWTDSEVPAAGDLSVGDDLLIPAVSGQYALLGRTVFTRSPTGGWERIHDLPETIVGRSCALRGAGYLSYQREDEPTTEVVFFQNGEVKPEIMRLVGEHSLVADPQAGEVLAGASTLVTYKGDSLAQARQLTLHRVIDADMPTEPQVPVVTKATLDDGYAQRTISVGYEADGAALDASASTAQFTRVRMEWPSDPDRGSTLHTYYNGLDPDADGAFYPPDDKWSNVRGFLSLVNGQIWTSEAFDSDGRPVSRVASTFWVYDRATGPQGNVPAATLRDPEASNLAGVYMRPRRSERTLILPVDSETGPTTEITSTETYEYNVCGQPSATTAHNVAGDGSEERFQTATTYAWEVYDALRDLHILTPVAQSLHRNDVTGDVTGIDVTTYIDSWPSASHEPLWGPRDSYTWRGQEGTAPFDFAAWSDRDSAPDGWLLNGRVIDRSPRGVVLEDRNVDGLHKSLVLDRDGVVPVATLDGVSRSAGEGWYWGFETYEDPGPWDVGPAGSIDQGTAFAGRRSLLAGGSAEPKPSLSASFQANEQSGSLMLSCRCCTGYGSGTAPVNAQWQVQAGSVTRHFTAQATDGAWQLWHVPLHPADFGLQGFTQVTVDLINSDPGLALRVDSVFFSPLIGAASASVYSEPHELAVATVDRLAAASWSLFDDLRRPIGEIGDVGVPVSMAARYSWAALSDSFDPSAPSFDLQIHPRVAGSYLNPAQGDGYLNGWQQSGAWERDGSALTHSGDAEGLITTRWARSEATFALRARLEGDASASYGLVIGADRLAYGDGQWRLLGPGGNELAAAPAAAPPERDLVVLGSAVGVQVYGEGRLLLDAKIGPRTAGTLGAFASGSVCVSQLVAANGVGAGATFRDNAARPIQSQRMVADGVIAQANILDPGGRLAAQTRALSTAGRLLGFRPDLVESFDWSSGILTGAVAEEYPGDDGYPYGRRRYDPSPLARPVETGLPGRQLAIDPRIPPADRHTHETLHEAAAQQDERFGLPEGGFVVNGWIDQDGVRVRRATDRLGRPVREVHDSARDPSTPLEIRAWEYDHAGRLATLRLPNYFDSGRSDAQKFCERFTYDFLGRLVQREQPDTDAPSQSVYDAAGRVRFSVDANGAAEGTFTYRRYDRLGRLIEDGICRGTWNREELAVHAEDRNWLPPAAQPLATRSYDGDGSDPYAVGKLVATSSLALDPNSASVREAFRYDSLGKLTNRSQLIDVIGTPDQVEFAYDVQGSLIRQTYTGPDGSSFTLDLVRDGEGRLIRLQARRSTQPAQTLANYTYTPEGQVQEETLASSFTAPLSRSYEYGPAGWLSKIQDRFFSQAVGYEGSYAGRVTATDEQFASPPPVSGFLAKFQTEVEHDAQGRLRSVANSAGAEFELGTKAPLSYDRNGNLVSLSRGGVAQQHEFAAGTNRLTEVEGQRPGHYEYDGNGAVAQSTALQIASIRRHPSSGRPLEIVLDNGAKTEYAYTADGERALEQNDAGASVSIHDGNGRLVARRVRVGNDWQTICYVHGPAGLIAACSDRRSLFTVRDRLGSIRGVYDGERLVAAASYQALGDPLGARWIDADLEDLLPQGFTGQPAGPSGLILFPARLYDPVVARFDRPDPAGHYSSPYVYAAGDPLSFVDPNGEDFLGALLGITLGLVLVVVGVAAIVASAGAATPGVAAAYSVAGSAALGAGIGSAGYGVTHASADAPFHVGEWLGLTALGGLFGAISGGISTIATQSALTASQAFLAESALGVVAGGADGYVSNGVVNVSNGQDFDDRWGSALLSGAGGGLLGGATAGFMGRRVALQNVREISDEWDAAERDATILAYRIKSNHWPSHSVLGLRRSTRAVLGYDQELNGPDDLCTLLWDPPTTKFGRWKEFSPRTITRGISAEFKVPPAQYVAVGRRVRALGAVNPAIRWSPFSNSCTSNVIDAIEGTGIKAPPWAYSPTTLVWWLGGLPS